MPKEIRNIYPGEAVFLNGRQVNRAQTLGATSTFNNENIHELGNFNIVEVIEDAPSVAVTLDTNDYATINNLASVSGRNPDKTRLITLSSFETAVADVVAPVIQGSDYGKTGVNAAAGTLTILRTMFIEKAFINNIELSYSTGGTATENFALESDNKAWYFNDASNVVDAQITQDGATTKFAVSTFTLDSGLTVGLPELQQLNDGSYTLGTDEFRVKKVVLVDTLVADLTTLSGYSETEYVYDDTFDWNAGAGSATFSATGNKFQIGQNLVTANANTGRYEGSGIEFQHAGATPAATSYIRIRYTGITGGQYFTPNTDHVGGIRQGQAQLYLIPTLKDTNGLEQINWTDYDIFWRVTSVTVSTPLSREVLNELGHHRPYSRTITFPVEISVSVESIDSDTEMFCKLSGVNFESIPQGTEVDIDSMLKDLNLVIKIYRYTDVQRKQIKARLANAGVTITGWVEAESCIKDNNAELIAYGDPTGVDSCVLGSNGIYYFLHDLIPMKVVSVRKLTATDEGQTLSVGSNATQSFSFKAFNVQFGVGGASPQTLSVPVSGEALIVNSGALAPWTYDLNNLGLSINRSGTTEVDGFTYVEEGTSEWWQAYKWGLSEKTDTADAY